jgi:hypothetical protein
MQHEDYQTLVSELKHFTGTETYYRHGLNPRMLWTDGVQHFAEKAEAFWVLDVVALGANGNPGLVPQVIPKLDRFAIVRIQTPKGECHMDAVDDIPGSTLWHERIGYSSLPDDIQMKFYLWGKNGEKSVLMLPGEY